jgi:predicted unusual protein kinase regulating ubiquinone biosynthesis (AarF/ABC1/UbiB family)
MTKLEDGTKSHNPDTSLAVNRSPLKRNYKRYIKILVFFAGELVKLGFWDILLPRIGFGGIASRSRARRFQEFAHHFRIMAIHLGGVMIKVGQFLSTRVDILPIEIVSELAGLQDEVPPEKFDEIKSVAELELGAPLTTKYVYFDPIPLAAASLGQVHRAVLWLQPPITNTTNREDTNTEQLQVVVKVQRPKIEEIIQTDLAALRVVGQWLEKYPPIRKRANIDALLNEFAVILFEEIDYIKEGENAETFEQNFQNVHGVYVPRVVWSHSSKRVLTLEDVGGIKITDRDQLIAASIPLQEVASHLIDLYLKQIFEDGFFHADPHPGNLFVRKKGLDEWEITFVDFGMVGHVPHEVRIALRELLMGVGTRNPDRVIHAYQMLGILLPEADLELIKKAETRLFDQFWGKSMDELRNTPIQEMANFTIEFRQLLFDLPFQIPYNILYLARTVGILSGMATALNPGFNVWLHLAPYAERLIAEEAFNFETLKLSPEKWIGEIERLIQRFFSLPLRTEALLERVERGELIVRDPAAVEQIRQIRIGIERATAGIIFAAFMVTTVILYANRVPPIYIYAGGIFSIFALWQVIRARS